MASRLKLNLILAVAALAMLPGQVPAHQLMHANGAVVPHQHVFKRAEYGQGFVTGHVAPTRHGHNMIIWSAAPSNILETPVPQMHITKPNRQRQLHPRRASQINEQLRQLNQRDDRR